MLGITNKVIVDYIESIKGNILFLECRDSEIIRKKHNNILVMSKSEIRKIKEIKILFIVIGKIYNNFFLRKIGKLNNEEKIAIAIAKKVYIVCNKVENIKKVKVPVIINKFLINKARRHLNKGDIEISTIRKKKYIEVKKNKYKEIREVISKIPYIIKDGIFEIRRKFRILIVSKNKVSEIRKC
ncbi:hypothetical protein [Candidatus Vidania fulgoroideorum]